MTIFPYTIIKDRILEIAKFLMTIPYSNVWTHEKAIHKLIKALDRDNFGPYHSLTIVMKGIEKGYCGSKREGCTNTNYAVSHFS